jgi:hypothetical protein
VTLKSLCRTGKPEYASKEDAIEGSKRAIARRDFESEGRNPPDRPYECTYCWQWHLTTKEDGKWKKKQPGQRVRGAKGQPWKGER